MRLSFRVAVVGAAVVAVFSPLLRTPTSDTYPLSTYPMFATDRGELASFATAVEIGTDGDAVRLSPQLIAGTDEAVLASVTVTRAVGSGEAAELCAEIASRLGPGRVISVRTEVVDVVAYVADDVPAVSIEEHARCGDR